MMMNTRPLLLSLLTLGLGFSPPLRADPTPAKPGYKVLLDVDISATGTVEDARIVQSDDFSGEQVLNQIAMLLAAKIHPAQQMKDGQPVKFTVRVPFDFPVEGDEGAAANLAPKPSLHGKSIAQPVYPAALAAKGEMGGAIVELLIDADGHVKNATVLRASHPEFGEAALAAVKQWEFKPAMKDGVPGESRWRLAISFTIDVKEVDWQWRVAPRPSLGGYKVVHRTTPPPAAPAAAPAVPAVQPAPAPGK